MWCVGPQVRVDRCRLGAHAVLRLSTTRGHYCPVERRLIDKYRTSRLTRCRASFRVRSCFPACRATCQCAIGQAGEFGSRTVNWPAALVLGPGTNALIRRDGMPGTKSVARYPTPAPTDRQLYRRSRVERIDSQVTKLAGKAGVIHNSGLLQRGHHHRPDESRPFPRRQVLKTRQRC